MKDYQEFIAELSFNLFQKNSESGPPLSSNQMQVMKGIKGILAKDSSEMNIRKAKATIDKYVRSHPDVDDKTLNHMKKMIDVYAN